MLYSYKDNWNAFVDGLLPALVCIVVVFVILAVIMVFVMLLNHIKTSKKTMNDKEVVQPTSTNNSSAQKVIQMSDIQDEDMMVAILIATIDYRQEIKKDVRLVNVKQVG